jgi:hypothetical protein
VSSIEGRPAAEIPLLGRAAPQGPAGIGGWLLLVAFVQLLATFVLPVRLAYQYFDPEYLEVFREFPLAGYGELVLNIAAVLFALVTTILLFRKSRHFPRFFILEFIASIVVPLLQTAWVAFAFSSQLGRPISEFLELEPQDIRQFVLALISAAIWIPYTLRSKRVRNTFILGLSARDMIVDADAGAQRLETPRLLAIGAIIIMLGMSSIVLGVGLTINRGVFNGSIVGGAVQVGLALWLLRGSDVARLILALLFALGTGFSTWIAFFPGQNLIATIVLLAMAALCAVVFWFLAFSKRFRAELEINEAKYRKVEAGEAGES